MTLRNTIMIFTVSLRTCRPALWAGLLTTFVASGHAGLLAEDPVSREAMWRQIEKYFQPPAEFVGQFGSYKSPLTFADGMPVKTADDWARRRKEILATWHRRLGPWPPLLEKPELKRIETVERDGFQEQ